MNGPEEFWAAVNMSGGANACWPWMRSVRRKRRWYGQVRWQGIVWAAHRLAYTLAVGVIPEDMTIDHTCHDPNTCIEPCPHTRCCNPAHLEAVSLVENIARRAMDTCGRGHTKTVEHGYVRGDQRKWRCRTCDVDRQRERRARSAAVSHV